MTKPEESGPSVYHSTDTMGGHWLTIDSLDGRMQHILSRAPGVTSGKKTLALEKKHKKKSAATGSRVRAHLGHVSPQKGIIRRHQGRAPQEPILTPAPLPKEFLELHEADLHDTMHGHQDRLVDKINAGEATPAEHSHFSKIRGYLDGLVKTIKKRGGKTVEALEREEKEKREKERVENAEVEHIPLYRGMSQEGYSKIKSSGMIHPEPHNPHNNATRDIDTAKYYASTKVHEDPGVVIKFNAPKDSVKEDEVFKGDYRIIKPISAEGHQIVHGEHVENAAHKYSSTQFNMSDAGYNRTQGSPLPTIQYLIDLVDDSDLAKDGKETNPHITVKYGLHTDDPEDVKEALQEWTTEIGGRTVGATLGDVTFFPGDEFDVVKIDVESECLRSLNKALSELPHTDTHPKYNPHLTLAYVKPGLGKKYEGPGLEGHEILLHVLVLSDKDRNFTYIDLWKLGNTNGETY